MSRDLSFFFLTHAQFSRVIESSFKSHIVHEVMEKIPGSKGYHRLALRVGLVGISGLLSIFLSLHARAASKTSGTKARSKVALGYLPLDVSGHLEYHSNHREKNTILSLFPFYFLLLARLCLHQQQVHTQVCLLRPLMI